MYAEKFYDQVDSASAKYQLLTLPLQILKGCLTFIFDDSVKKKKRMSMTLNLLGIVPHLAFLFVNTACQPNL